MYALTTSVTAAMADEDVDKEQGEGGHWKWHKCVTCRLNEEFRGVFESWEQAEQHGNVSDFKTELILVFWSYQSEMIN